MCDCKRKVEAFTVFLLFMKMSQCVGAESGVKDGRFNVHKQTNKTEKSKAREV